MNSIRTIFFDFDGVLGSGHFYTGKFKKEYPDVHQWIQENIFGNEKIFLGWLRGRISYLEVDRIISNENSINQDIVDRALIDSAKDNKLINEDVKSIIVELRDKEYKLGLISDNVDVFSEFTVTAHELNKIFDVVVNSADYGALKEDENGKLFKIALNLIGEDDISRSLLIDDGEKNIETYIALGGQGYFYKNFEDFEDFINKI